ncbi:MAG: alpha/beta hydrolase [Candidatus Hydrogenedentota bacterium]
MTEVLLSPKQITVKGDGGVAINVRDHGGDGPDLILCHCTGTHARIWDPLVPELLKHFRVIAPDTRGHGLSGKPVDDEQYSWQFAGEDLHNVIAQLDLGPTIHAVGHSAGAAQIATCQAHYPSTFQRAVLIDPIIGPSEMFQVPNPLGILSRKRKNHFASREEARERFASKPPMASWTPETLDAYVQHGLLEKDDGTFELACPPHAEGATYDHGGVTGIFAKLDELNFERSAHVTATNSNVRQIIELQRPGLSASKFIEIPDATHFIPQEKPLETLKIILETLL